MHALWASLSRDPSSSGLHTAHIRGTPGGFTQGEVPREALAALVTVIRTIAGVLARPYGRAKDGNPGGAESWSDRPHQRASSTLRRRALMVRPRAFATRAIDSSDTRVTPRSISLI